VGSSSNAFQMRAQMHFKCLESEPCITIADKA
jgi:hypothetical protein